MIIPSQPLSLLTLSNTAMPGPADAISDHEHGVTHHAKPDAVAVIITTDSRSDFDTDINSDPGPDNMWSWHVRGEA